MNATLHELETPALVLDEAKLDRNIARVHERVHSLGSVLRPHVKTAKSIDIVRRSLVGEPGGITVSTLKEAEYFFAHGIHDIVYAVGIAPVKLPHVISLIQRGASIAVITDNVAAVHLAGQAAAKAGVTLRMLIELDVDGHRAGVHPDSELLLELARSIAASRHLELRGVLTHAGESYQCRDLASLRALAELERSGSVRAAQRLRAAGFPAPVVSVGSTPTGLYSASLEGVTEVRMGVYMFQDLVMAGINVCTLEEIALSVLVSVIGHQRDRGWIITDGGWTAMSRDRGTAEQPVDQGYGVVRDVDGHALADDLIVRSVNQEHGVIARRDGALPDFDQYSVGSLLRVLPNHACATAAQHERYHVVRGARDVVATWERINGW